MTSGIGLLTSCIVPNTKSGPISTFSTKKRIKDLIENINYISYKALFNEIYIVDPFIKNKDYLIKFQSLLKNNGLLNENLKYIIFNPSKDITENIKKKGKGYSEIQMIIESLRIINKNHKNCQVHKISGRYKVLNLNKLIGINTNLLSENIDIVIPYSKLLSKCYTVMYSFKSDISLRIFRDCLDMINDEKYNYVEHSMYKNIISNKKNLFKRSKTFIKLNPRMIGGSKQGKYNVLKQFLNYIFYSYL